MESLLSRGKWLHVSHKLITATPDADGMGQQIQGATEELQRVHDQRYYLILP